MQQGEEQLSMIMMETRANGMLFLGEGEESDADYDPEAASGPLLH